MSDPQKPVRIKRQLLDVHGILLLDKPVGLTSNRALQEAKRLLQARHAPTRRGTGGRRHRARPAPGHGV